MHGPTSTAARGDKDKLEVREVMGVDSERLSGLPKATQQRSGRELEPSPSISRLLTVSW